MLFTLLAASLLWLHENLRSKQYLSPEGKCLQQTSETRQGPVSCVSQHRSDCCELGRVALGIHPVPTFVLIFAELLVCKQQPGVRNASTSSGIRGEREVGAQRPVIALIGCFLKEWLPVPPTVGRWAILLSITKNSLQTNHLITTPYAEQTAPLAGARRRQQRVPPESPLFHHDRDRGRQLAFFADQTCLKRPAAGCCDTAGGRGVQYPGSHFGRTDRRRRFPNP